MSDSGPSLPNRNVRFDGEFRRESGLVLLTTSITARDPEETSDARCSRLSGCNGSAYATLTFQNIGATNLRTSRTFFRKAVGWTHSPHGTYGTSLKATFWTSA